jgi:hypothetical protein
MNGVKNSTKCLTLLSGILLTEEERSGSGEPMSRVAAGLCAGELAELEGLANSHHVVMRAFPRLQQMMSSEGNAQSAEWAARAVEKEGARIENALSFLEPVCRELEAAGKVIVIKSLDHWPDLGSDLDLYTDADAPDVAAIMHKRFDAKLAARSWGDRLASKWNFVVPGLPEPVEVHVGRLGQTGEQVAIAKSMAARARSVEVASRRFRVPAPEERLLISTLQRMYRHYYIRLCDIVDNVRLVENQEIDYAHLRSLSHSAGLWDGLATYLMIISDYAKFYRGNGILLPAQVQRDARFGRREVCFRKNFIRIPVVPYSARLYASELARLVLNGEIRNSLRLSLLPGLATVALLELKLAGSDKGIW